MAGGGTVWEGQSRVSVKPQTQARRKWESGSTDQGPWAEQGWAGPAGPEPVFSGGAPAPPPHGFDGICAQLVRKAAGRGGGCSTGSRSRPPQGLGDPRPGGALWGRGAGAAVCRPRAGARPSSLRPAAPGHGSQGPMCKSGATLHPPATRRLLAKGAPRRPRLQGGCDGHLLGGVSSPHPASGWV